MKGFLKWVGGKTQLLDQIMPRIPTTIANYYEPFLGGGSVLLSILQSSSHTITGQIYASDANPALICLYRTLQTSPDALIAELQRLVAEFTFASTATPPVVNRAPSTLGEAQTSAESYYYWVRGQFNVISDAESPRTAAMFLFLNKTCFRGLYREGPRGFNVPFGHYKNPSIYDATQLREIAVKLQRVHFAVSPFTDALSHVSPGDFVYLDPPYAPETTTSFVGYTADGFTTTDHQSLFSLCHTIHTRGARFLLSNANVPLVTSAFPSPPYTTKIVVCRRAIHSKKPDATTNEVLIYN